MITSTHALVGTQFEVAVLIVVFVALVIVDIALAVRLCLLDRESAEPTKPETDSILPHQARLCT